MFAYIKILHQNRYDLYISLFLFLDEHFTREVPIYRVTGKSKIFTNFAA